MGRTTTTSGTRKQAVVRRRPAAATKKEVKKRPAVHAEAGWLERFEMYLCEEGEFVSGPAKLAKSSNIPNCFEGLLMDHNTVWLPAGQLPLKDKNTRMRYAVLFESGGQKIVFRETHGKLQAMLLPLVKQMYNFCDEAVSEFSERMSCSKVEQFIEKWREEKATEAAEEAWTTIGKILKKQVRVGSKVYRYEVKRLTCLSSIPMGGDTDLIVNVCGRRPEEVYDSEPYPDPECFRDGEFSCSLGPGRAVVEVEPCS